LQIITFDYSHKELSDFLFAIGYCIWISEWYSLFDMVIDINGEQLFKIQVNLKMKKQKKSL